jgi:Fic family protein
LSTCATTLTKIGHQAPCIWLHTYAVHLAAYVLWKLNWIHPFADGNGRTARAIAYVVLSIKLDSVLPGAPTIPEQIAGNKKPYYDALEAADKHLAGGEVDVSDLEKMLDAMLSTQLLSAAKEASGEIEKPERQILH